MNFDDFDPTDPDAHQPSIMMLYGAAMMTVQTFEQALVVASLTATIGPDSSSGEEFVERFPALYSKMWKAFQRGSAKPTLDRLKEHIPESEYETLRQFIEKRNWFCHRFFPECFDHDERRFARGTIVKLIDMQQDTSRALAIVQARTNILVASRRAENTPTDIPDEFMQWATDLFMLTSRRKVRPEVAAAIRARREERRGQTDATTEDRAN